MAHRDAILLSALFLGCAHSEPRSDHSASAVAQPSNVSETRWRVPAGAAVGERNRCVDRELRTRDLNEWGDPAGTTYPEGHPLGLTQATDRFDYVLQRYPGIRTSCSQTGLEPER
jgi:hypothetical protein